MTDRRFWNSKRAIKWLGLLSVGVLLPISARSQDVPPPPSEVGPPPSGNPGEPIVLNRGPVHEAFAEQYDVDVTPGIAIPQAPPEPVNELPPEQTIAGDDVVWIPGYWAWDDEREDFLWVSGIWRKVPPNQTWIPGYWAEANDGYQWVSGFWVNADSEEFAYVPTPPESLENGPNTDPPANNYIWVPGAWDYASSSYNWRPGYWAGGHDEWVWIPARYVWTPAGCVYAPGYWDYRITSRGVLFSPVYFGPNFAWNPGYNYVPSYAVDCNPLIVHLWVRPRFHHYYFGNYYGPAYAGFGYQSWIVWGRQRPYDPFFNYYAYRSRVTGIDYLGRYQGWHDYYVRNDRFRPPATQAAQGAFLAQQGGVANQPMILSQTLQQLGQQNQLAGNLVNLNSNRRNQLTTSSAALQSLGQSRSRLEGNLAGGIKPGGLSGRQNVRLPLNQGANLQTTIGSSRRTPLGSSGLSGSPRLNGQNNPLGGSTLRNNPLGGSGNTLRNNPLGGSGSTLRNNPLGGSGNTLRNNPLGGSGNTLRNNPLGGSRLNPNLPSSPRPSTGGSPLNRGLQPRSGSLTPNRLPNSTAPNSLRPPGLAPSGTTTPRLNGGLTPRGQSPTPIQQNPTSNGLQGLRGLNIPGLNRSNSNSSPSLNRGSLPSAQPAPRPSGGSTPSLRSPSLNRGGSSGKSSGNSGRGLNLKRRP